MTAGRETPLACDIKVASFSYLSADKKEGNEVVVMEGRLTRSIFADEPRSERRRRVGREAGNVAGTVTPCLALISVCVTDRFTGMISELTGVGPGVRCSAAARDCEGHARKEQRPADSRSTSIRG